MEDEVHLGITLTRVVLAAVAVALILYDIAIGMLFGREATITCVLRMDSKEHLIIALGIGAVLGHIYWR